MIHCEEPRAEQARQTCRASIRLRHGQSRDSASSILISSTTLHNEGTAVHELGIELGLMELSTMFKTQLPDTWCRSCMKFWYCLSILMIRSHWKSRGIIHLALRPSK